MTTARSVLVTGAIGFLGAVLVGELLKRGYQVDAYARNLEKGRKAFPEGVRLIEGDLVDAERLKSVLETDYAAVIHLGVIRNPWGMDEGAVRAVNLGSTECIVRSIVGRNTLLVYCSSALVDPIFRETAYSRMKKESERVIESECGNYIILRPSVLYGAGDPIGTVCNLSRVLKRGIYRTIGDGENRLVLTHVKDVARAFVMAMETEQSRGQKITLADVPGMKINEYVEKVAAELGVRVPRRKIPRFVGQAAGFFLEKAAAILRTKGEPVINVHKVDVMVVDHDFDTSAAKRLIGFTPEVDFEDGLRDNIKYFLRIEGA